MASSEGTQPLKMNKRETTLAFIEACRSLPGIWDIENRHDIMADVASKQATALFLSTTVSRTSEHIKLTKKLINLMGNLCCAKEHSVQYSCSFFTQLNCTV
jgi:hypothetical protein